MKCHNSKALNKDRLDFICLTVKPMMDYAPWTPIRQVCVCKNRNNVNICSILTCPLLSIPVVKEMRIYTSVSTSHMDSHECLEADRVLSGDQKWLTSRSPDSGGSTSYLDLPRLHCMKSHRGRRLNIISLYLNKYTASAVSQGKYWFCTWKSWINTLLFTFWWNFRFW